MKWNVEGNMYVLGEILTVILEAERSNNPKFVSSISTNKIHST